MAEYTVTFAELNDLDGVKIHIYSDAGRTTEVAGSPLTTADGGGATIDLADGVYYFRAKKQGYADLDDDFEVDGEALGVDFTMLRGSFDFVAAVTGSVETPSTFAFRVYGAVSCEVDWGLGAGWEAIADGADKLVSKDFEVTGDRTIKLRGTATRVAFYAFDDPDVTPQKLRDITSKISDGMAGINTCWEMFRDSGLSGEIPEWLFEGLTGIASGGFRSTFRDCPQLSGTIPSDLFADNPGVSIHGFTDTFRGSSGLAGIGVGLFRNNPLNNSYTRTFQDIGAVSFPDGVGEWAAQSVVDATDTFAGTTISVAEYTEILDMLVEQNLQPSVSFGGGTNKYTLAGGGSKYRLMRDFGWTFTDGGIETDKAEYEITTVQEAQGMGVLLAKDFTAMNDIDMAATSGWGHDNKGWAPIGTAAAPFTGTFDGQGHVIDGLTINRPFEPHVGLFGYATTGLLESVKITNASVIGGANVGILVGWDNHNALFARHVTTSGSVTGTVGGTSGRVGGVFGVIGNSGWVNDCHSAASVVGGDNAARRGGLCGWNYKGKVARCFSSGAVSPTGGSSGGGFVGFVGTGDAYEDTANFWDTETSGWATSEMGTGKTTAQMKTLLTFLSRLLTRAFLTAFGHGGTLTGRPNPIGHEAGAGSGGAGANAWDIVLKADHDGEKATAIWFIDEGTDYPRLWFEYE